MMAFHSKNDYLVVREENDVLIAHADSFRERLGKVGKGANSLLGALGHMQHSMRELIAHI